MSGAHADAYKLILKLEFIHVRLIIWSFLSGQIRQLLVHTNMQILALSLNMCQWCAGRKLVVPPSSSTGNRAGVFGIRRDLLTTATSVVFRWFRIVHRPPWSTKIFIRSIRLHKLHVALFLQNQLIQTHPQRKLPNLSQHGGFKM